MGRDLMRPNSTRQYKFAIINSGKRDRMRHDTTIPDNTTRNFTAQDNNFRINMQNINNDFQTKSVAFALLAIMFLLCLTLWWQSMRQETELQAAREMVERNNELILDIRQEIVAQEKQNRQAFEQLRKSIEGEW